MTFETYLEEEYDKINTNSNNMNPEFESARERWFENLDIQEVMDYAETFAQLQFLKGEKSGIEQAKKIMNTAFKKGVI